MVMQGVVAGGGFDGGVGAGSGPLETVETGPAQSVFPLETEEVAQAMTFFDSSV